MKNSWDKVHKERFEVLSNKMKFVPENDGHEWHFELNNINRIYFDELAFMIEYLQAIGEMRMKINATSPRDKF